jgi:hypothetical protein
MRGLGFPQKKAISSEGAKESGFVVDAISLVDPARWIPRLSGSRDAVAPSARRLFSQFLGLAVQAKFFSALRAYRTRIRLVALFAVSPIRRRAVTPARPYAHTPISS